MKDKFISGKITFIHHEKNRAVIEYTDNGRLKNINGDVSDKAQARLIEEKIIKKTHRFLIGDNVTFIIKKTGANGNVLYADHIRYQYNTALEILVNKAATENKFLGYIKMTGEDYFIKEIDSYLFFPLKISPFELPPDEKDTRPVTFKLDNIANPEKIAAVLYNHNYIPEFLTAVQHFKKQTVVEAAVHNITPYGIYLNLVKDKITSKLAISDSLKERIENKTLQVNTVIPVKIKHISDSRIIVEEADQA